MTLGVFDLTTTCPLLIHLLDPDKSIALYAPAYHKHPAGKPSYITAASCMLAAFGHLAWVVYLILTVFWTQLPKVFTLLSARARDSVRARSIQMSDHDGADPESVLSRIYSRHVITFCPTPNSQCSFVVWPALLPPAIKCLRFDQHLAMPNRVAQPSRITPVHTCSPLSCRRKATQGHAYPIFSSLLIRSVL